MQNSGDLSKVQASDKTYHKLELSLEAEKITQVDWYDLQTAIAANTVIREVHIRCTKEFTETFPHSQLLELCRAIGSLKNLKYLFLGPMTGPVTTFDEFPVPAMTMLISTAGEKLWWWYVRGMIFTHVYKGSDEEKEDKSGVLDASTHRERRSSAKEKKKKESKKSSKKDSKKESKKSSKKEIKKEKETTPAPEIPAADKLTIKQNAAKRALEKLGDSIMTLKSLKKVSLMGHLEDVMAGFVLDPLVEGLTVLNELETVVVAITRHTGRVPIDPPALGSFLESSPKVKECSFLYMTLTDDHIDEVASAIGKAPALKELTLSGVGSATPESVGALFRTPHLQKLTLQELVLDETCLVAMCIALAHCSNLTHLEIVCPLTNKDLLALQQMILVNQGLERLVLHITSLESASAPLDLATSILASNPNQKSKLTQVILEAEDARPDTKLFRDIDVQEWDEVIQGIFKAERSHTATSSRIALTKI